MMAVPDPSPVYVWRSPERASKLEAAPKILTNCSPYRAVDTLRLGYTNQSVNVV